ncbi:MAG: SulP family inorganic anion transporter [Bauldia sp.]
MSARSLRIPSTPNFTPKLVTVFREGYGLRSLRADAIAGITVAIVALPLSMAIAIASGVPPERGLYTAIIGGFLISALGGSRFQIGGPAGAFIVLVAGTVLQHGIDGMVLATFMAGGLLVLMGLLRVGSYIRYIPLPVTVGFTAGIAVIIFASQIHDLLGLSLAHEPAEFAAKIEALWGAASSITPAAVAIAVLTIGIILFLRRKRPTWPALLIAVAVASVAGALFHLPLETIGTRFGGIPSGLPAPHLPAFSLEKVTAVLPDAIAFAFLGAIESLLSAVVADSMTGRRHRSNGELVAQGVANMGSALFGGICATGTIARTATNIRAGAKSPIAGMLHALFLLLFMLVAAPVASYIPLAALAGVLAVVAFNMVEWHALRRLLRTSWGDVLAIAVTLGVTLFRDLVEGIAAGLIVCVAVLIGRMVKSMRVSGARDEGHEDVEVLRLSGPLFFGTAAETGPMLARSVGTARHVVVDLSDVWLLDASAADGLERTVASLAREGRTIHLAGGERVGAMLRKTIVDLPSVHLYGSVEEALTAITPQPSPAATAATAPENA